MPDEMLLEVTSVSKRFQVRGQTLHAVENVSFALRSGETLGLVGESGSGKSTLGRTVLRLLEADAGRVVFQGRDLSRLSVSELRKERRHMQIIFQDPLASLNPRMTVGSAIEDAMIIQGIASRVQRKMRVNELLERVGLPLQAADAFPFELSGGQQQRVGIARALSVRPKLVVCDEPISALDVSIQVQIIELLKDLQRELQLAYIFISHNLGVVQHLSDRVMVLYLGEVVEQGSAQDLFTNPQHPYTRVLLDSILKIPSSSAERRPLVTLPGEIPSPFHPPSGCPFHPRCTLAYERCTVEKPILQGPTTTHLTACHLAETAISQ
ncbi:MAG: ABC transporter ATP-binding protein [Firmicutes bacterium]|nr:ABC transporter ATP-binding protein [Bacillota bacterium]